MDIPEILEAMQDAAKRFESWLWIVQHCDMVSGVCMCGDSMENHASPMSAGHEPVDMCSYSQGKLIESTEADLSKLRRAIAALEGMQKAEEQITILASGSLDEAVNRFLGWRLPENFSPDAGISFNPEYNVEYMAKQGKPPMRHEPTGTNLFTADQARQMIEYILGIPAAPKPTGEE